jgi:hypothetical protein
VAPWDMAHKEFESPTLPRPAAPHRAPAVSSYTPLIETRLSDLSDLIGSRPRNWRVTAWEIHPVTTEVVPRPE